ncbi:MAG: LEA type 2 family protein [Flavobacteriales bacterium]|nr:LEA type 2 family protein [Flavobacteriales bacterium]
MRKLRVLLLPLSLCLLLVSCITYEDVEMLGLEDIKMKEFSTSGVEAIVSMKVKNPNNYKISIVNSDLDLFINGSKLGKAVIKDKIVIKKDRTEVYSFTVGAKPSGGILGSLLSMAFSKNVKVGVKGKVKARAFMVSKSFDVDVEQNVSL